MVTETDFTFSLAGSPYLEFLPVVDLSNGRLLGMEALVRWQHPTEGVITPAQLLPQAEASGDIRALTRWVLMEACQQAGTWSPSIQLGVNCTIHQLRRGEVSTAVRDALEATGFPSGQLTLEVTEEAIVDSSASGDMKDLGQMGVQLSVDDVGTNWSSFEPFKRHSISTVKIDGSFISGLESTQGINRLVVETVIHMAHSLGMSAIVEQVETVAQVEIVRSFQADAAQGFFFARPMSSENAAELARCDEVPHFSRTSEQTLLRRVGGTTVEEAFVHGPGVESTFADPRGDGETTEVDGVVTGAAGPATDGREDVTPVTEAVTFVTEDETPVTEDVTFVAEDDTQMTDDTADSEPVDGTDGDDPDLDAAPDGDTDLGAEGSEDDGSDAGPGQDRPVPRAAGARVGRKRLKNRTSRSA
jgi:EAL domain-containing protein (putative c-di-GMP-specific phosphodiesterase class I)